MSLSRWLNRISEWFGLPWSMLVEAPATWSHSSKVLYTETLTELEGEAQIIQITHFILSFYPKILHWGGGVMTDEAWTPCSLSRNGANFTTDHLKINTLFSHTIELYVHSGAMIRGVGFVVDVCLCISFNSQQLNLRIFQIEQTFACLEAKNV